MLKFTYLVQLGLAGALTLPAMTWQDGYVEELLAEIERALAELSNDPSAAAGESTDPVERALRLSEAPLAGEQEREELLLGLRDEVGGLQQRLDELEVLGFDPSAVVADPAGTAQAAQHEPAPRTGLGDGERELLALEVKTQAAASALLTGLAPSIAFEPTGYSADPVRHGRACFRAGLHGLGLDLLERHAGVPEADFWRARCLEGLGRLPDALRVYETLLNAVEPGSELALSATQERDFVAWQLAFEERLGARSKP